MGNRIIEAAAVLILALLPGGCQYDIKLEGASNEKKIFLNCFPSDRDTTLISVYVARPLGYKGAFDYSGKSAGVSMWVDGKEVLVRQNDGISSSMADGTKFVTGKFSPGQNIRIVVGMDGIDPVSSEAVVPDRFPEYSIRLRKASGLVADLEYRSSSAGYFGMHIKRENIRYEDGKEVFRYDEYISPDYDRETENDFLLEDGTDITALDFGDGTFVFWEDGSFPTHGNVKTFSVPLKYLPDTEGPGLSFAGQEVNVEIVYRYKFILYTITRQMYNYLYARYAEGNDALASAGLAPAAFSYSNIVGGYGILGPMQTTESEWIDNFKE